jgi:phosphate transport system substrate-binding protein
MKSLVFLSNCAALAIAVAGLCTSAAVAQDLGSLAHYRPQQGITETLRSWGSKDMGDLLRAWQQGFRKYHPEVRYADNLKGTETAQAALYTEVADLALMDRDILTLERHVMLRRKHDFPLEMMVAVGDYRAPNHSPALAVLVHKDNPLARLTVKQLDGIFGEQRSGAWDDKFAWHTERARGTDENIRTWGELGLTGEWKDKPIQVYGYPVTNYSPLPGPMLSFRRKVFGGGDMWNPNIREYEKGGDITAALGHDRYGIAYAPLADATPLVRPVSLGYSDARGYVALTRESVASRAYPLTRAVYISISPEKPIAPKVKEFLRYVLSREGQETVARDGGYLPLTAEEVQAQLKKLD